VIPSPTVSTLTPETASGNPAEHPVAQTETVSVIVRGPELHILGLTGSNDSKHDPLSVQCRAALIKGLDALSMHGLGFDDVTRVVYLIQDGDAFTSCLGLLREAFAAARPVTTIRLVQGFPQPNTDIEIEMIAARR